LLEPFQNQQPIAASASCDLRINIAAFAAEIFFGVFLFTVCTNPSMALHAGFVFPETSCGRDVVSFFTSLSATPCVALAALINASYATIGSSFTHEVLASELVVYPIAHAVCEEAPGPGT
jgi:hypothetical protein